MISTKWAISIDHKWQQKHLNELPSHLKHWKQTKNEYSHVWIIQIIQMIPQGKCWASDNPDCEFKKLKHYIFKKFNICIIRVSNSMGAIMRLLLQEHWRGSRVGREDYLTMHSSCRTTKYSVNNLVTGIHRSTKWPVLPKFLIPQTNVIQQTKKQKSLSSGLCTSNSELLTQKTM